MFYVIATYKANPLKFHYNEVFLVDVSAIHLLLLKQKYEISAVDCTQIKDLNNLCVRPTIDCLQVNNQS